MLVYYKNNHFVVHVAAAARRLKESPMFYSLQNTVHETWLSSSETDWVRKDTNYKAENKSKPDQLDLNSRLWSVVQQLQFLCSAKREKM